MVALIAGYALIFVWLGFVIANTVMVTIVGRLVRRQLDQVRDHRGGDERELLPALRQAARRGAARRHAGRLL
jgi:hypothetical protein